MRSPLLLACCCAFITACTQNGGGNGHPVPEQFDTIMYTRLDTFNAQGFGRAVSGEGETHVEGVIDRKGVVIIAPRTSFLVNDITGSTALIQNGRVFQFADLSNGPLPANYFDTAASYPYAEPYRCGLAMVQQDDRRSYIDAAGRAVFNETFDFAETFHNDRAMVKQGERYRIIDTKGSTVAVMHYDQVNPQSPWCWQVARIKGDTYWSGFVDLNGREITPLIYDEVGYYDPEVKRIRVGKGEKYGFLDEHAAEVIKVQYEQAEVFDHGKARVTLNGREFFIDPMGREVAE